MGKTRNCQMHDLMRDLCLKRAEKENFLCVIRGGDVVDKARRIVFQRGTSSSLEQTTLDFDGLESASPLTRSLVSYQDLRSIKFKLLRVLNMPYLYDNWDDILKKVNLRYIDSRSDGNPGGLVSSISLLWNLQTLIIEADMEPVIAPPEIWEMRQLRHVEIWNLHLPDPPLSSSNHLPADEFVLPNLHSLKEVRNLRLSEEVCRRLPNLKQLAVAYDDLSGNLSFDFGRLHKLEYLDFQFKEIKPNVDDLLQSLTFPSSLQQLTLEGCHLRWEDLSMIGSLPNLQVLRLGEDSVTGGSEWSPAEGDQFLCLKYLKISFCQDLINWNINSDHYYSSTFPVLEKLVLGGLKNLIEIPSCIGGIPTLGSIDMLFCSESAAISAMKILEEQESLGNEGLQVQIKFWYKEELRSFKEKVQHMDCFTSTNLHLR